MLAGKHYRRGNLSFRNAAVTDTSAAVPCGAVRDLLSRYLNRQLSESNCSTLRTTCRAFSATAQMESNPNLSFEDPSYGS